MNQFLSSISFLFLYFQIFYSSLSSSLLSQYISDFSKLISISNLVISLFSCRHLILIELGIEAVVEAELVFFYSF